MVRSKCSQRRNILSSYDYKERFLGGATGGGGEGDGGEAFDRQQKTAPLWLLSRSVLSRYVERREAG